MSGINYGRALEALFPGPHRTKRVEKAFDVSPRMAKYLLSNKHWTLQRVMQAVDLFGDAWDIALSNPVSSTQHDIEMQDINRRLARLETYFAQMDRRDAAGLAPHDGGTSNQGSGGSSPDVAKSASAGKSEVRHG